MKARFVNFERGLDPKKAMRIGKGRDFFVGDRVALLPNEEEGWEYEEGVITWIDPDKGAPRMAYVKIDKQFQNPGDTGDREVEIDDQFIKHL